MNESKKLSSSFQNIIEDKETSKKLISTTKTGIPINQEIQEEEKNINININFDNNKTPIKSKKEEQSYSQLEIPESYQIGNGKCIHLKKTPITFKLQDSQNTLENHNLNNQKLNQNENININYPHQEEKIDISFSESSFSCHNNIYNYNQLFTNNLQSENSSSLNNGNFNDNNINTSFINYGKSEYIYPMKFIKRHYKKIINNSNSKETKQLKEKIKNGTQSQIHNLNQTINQSYKRFNLIKNPSYKYNQTFSSSPIHKFLPYNKKNDEQYKQKLLQYIHKQIPQEFKAPKSVNSFFSNYLNNLSKNKKIENNDENFYLLNINKKKKIKQQIYSTTKIFNIEKNLYNYKLKEGKNEVDFERPVKFRFYYDSDIGFDHFWQTPLIEENGDDDVETDDEVIELAKNKCQEDLFEGIENWNSDQRLCRNFNLIKKFNKTVNTPVFNTRKIFKKFEEKMINNIENKEKIIESFNENMKIKENKENKKIYEEQMINYKQTFGKNDFEN